VGGGDCYIAAHPQLNRSCERNSYLFVTFAHVNFDNVALKFQSHFHELAPWSREPVGRAASQEKLSFYGTRRFITTYTRTHHWTFSWSRWIQSTSSCHVFCKISFNVILRGLRSGFWPSHFATKMFSCVLRAHSILLDFIGSNIWWRVRTMKVLIVKIYLASC